MRGLMQDWPLTVNRIVEHASRVAGHREVVTRTNAGTVTRTTYADLHQRALRLSSALLDLGVRPADRIATLASNTAAHFETWYAIMGLGAVCHTLNPRLFPDQLIYIVRHAEDRILVADVELAPLVTQILDACPSIETVIYLGDGDEAAPGRPVQALRYEELIASHRPDAVWGRFDEGEACGLCYTSGTTGDPKGVLYSHRSNFLHAITSLQPDAAGIGVASVVMPIVPMFHANAWGMVFSCPAVGCKVVLPGARLDPASLCELLEGEGVTFAAAVPTVWQAVIEHLKREQIRLPRLERVLIGGSACPRWLISAFRDLHGVEVVHGWGMTEMSPIGSTSSLVPEVRALPFAEQAATIAKQGRPPLGVDVKIVGEDGESLPHDGRTAGRLMVRGPFVAARYFHGEPGGILDGDGYFDTGDIATLDRDSCITITDRAKDVIKSGGEWISSIEIENLVTAHPKAALAAVVGVPHPKWAERPILLVKLKQGVTGSPDEFHDFLVGKIAKWWLPDAVHIVADLPLGATGKVNKARIRQELASLIGDSGR